MNNQSNNAGSWQGYSIDLEDVHIPVGWRPVFVDELKNSDKNGKRSDYMILRTQDEKYQRIPLFAFINEKQMKAQDLVPRIIRACVSDDVIREVGGDFFRLFEKIKGKTLGAYIDKGTKKLTGEPYNKITTIMKYDEYVQMFDKNRPANGFTEAEIDAFVDVALVHDQAPRNGGSGNGGA